MKLGWNGSYITVLFDNHAEYVRRLPEETLRIVRNGNVWLMGFENSTHYGTLTNSLARAFFEWHMYRMIEDILMGATAQERKQDIDIIAKIIADRLGLPQTTTASIAEALRIVLSGMTTGVCMSLGEDKTHHRCVIMSVGEEQKYRKWLYPEPEQPANLVHTSVQKLPPSI